MIYYLPLAALVVFAFMTFVFILALFLKDNSIVDIFWGPGFIILTVFSLWHSGSIDLKKLLVSSMVLIWGLRLSIHIFLRNRGRGEDFRYANWRRTWKNFVLRSFLQVFMLQGFFMLVIAWPVMHINYGAPVGFGMIDFAGIVFFLTGFFFEAVGDYQMVVFKKDPANSGMIIATGLWKYTRHPNYFGEAMLWWGIWLMAVPVVDGIYTLLSPISITLLLRYVSGVPMLEKKYDGRADWEEYKSKTPVFVPFLNVLKG
jgi:steroid 5-alpha reductase family enzyme